MQDDVIDFGLPKRDKVVSASDPRIIKVVGVGGGGDNAVAGMYRDGFRDVRFEVCNTDYAALKSSPVPVRRQLGPDGLGVGGDPEKGKEIAEESLDEIHKMFADGTRMVFIVAGMGGGTGTGAAPVIAREAQSAGMLTVGVVTIPFRMEMKARIDRALDGLFELSKHVDSLLVINNERLFQLCAFKTLKDAFKMSDDTLLVAVKSIAEIITTNMQWNVDFCDVSAVLKGGGIALIGSGEAEGENRVTEALKKATESPLLNDNDIFNARKVVVCIYTSDNNDDTLTVPETKEIVAFMEKFTYVDIAVKFGLAYVPDMGDKIRITVLASGFGLRTQKYLPESMRTYVDDDVLGQVNPDEDSKNGRRKIFYPNSGSKRQRLVYRFSDDDLDNDDVIERVAESQTARRRYDAYKKIADASQEALPPKVISFA